MLRMIREGIDLPWSGKKPKSLRDPRTGGCPQNINLQGASEKVWDTLYEQLVEKAVLPWDCLQKEDVEVLPQGMFPIFWTSKSGTTKIRIVIDLRRLNRYLSEKYCSVVLPSVRKSCLFLSSGGVSGDCTMGINSPSA